MRILPRLDMPTRKAARRLWRHSKAHLNLRRFYYSVEFILFITMRVDPIVVLRHQ
jgi:hypothetical protein